MSCSAWTFCAKLVGRSHLVSAQRGFFVPGDPGTPQLLGNPGDAKS